jgi:hypothetical protein
VTGRRGRRRRKLLDDLKDRRGYSHLKEEALDRTMWRNRFGGGFETVVRQNTEWLTGNVAETSSVSWYLNSQKRLLSYCVLCTVPLRKIYCFPAFQLIVSYEQARWRDESMELAWVSSKATCLKNNTLTARSLFVRFMSVFKQHGARRLHDIWAWILYPNPLPSELKMTFPEHAVTVDQPSRVWSGFSEN